MGITGLPASGKTTALKTFARAGFATVSADALARAEYASPENRRRVKKEFGALSRKDVAAMIFSDDKKRILLETIIHPGVIRELRTLVRRARDRGKPFAAEVPLLFEKNLEKMFNTIVTVAAPRHILLTRMAAKGIPRRTAAGMIGSHLPQSQKAARSDEVVSNAGSIGRFRAAINRTIKAIMRG